VSLTELGIHLWRKGEWGEPARIPAACIPTCTDYGAFELARRKQAPLQWLPPADGERVQAAGLVLGYVGSVNASYCIDETLALARRILDLRRDALFVALTGQGEALDAAATRAGIAASKRICARVAPPRHSGRSCVDGLGISSLAPRRGQGGEHARQACRVLCRGRAPHPLRLQRRSGSVGASRRFRPFALVRRRALSRRGCRVHRCGWAATGRCDSARPSSTG
jgi:hypothetical protein